MGASVDVAGIGKWPNEEPWHLGNAFSGSTMIFWVMYDSKSRRATTGEWPRRSMKIWEGLGSRCASLFGDVEIDTDPCLDVSPVEFWILCVGGLFTSAH